MLASAAPGNTEPNRVVLTKLRAWKALRTHHTKMREIHLRELFASDPDRAERMNAEGAGLFLDYSKNRITEQTIRLLIQLAEESSLRQHIDAMFRGDRI